MVTATPRWQRAALVALCAVLFLTFLDNTIVAVALSDIQNELAPGVTKLQWIVNGYALVFAALMLAGGSLGDILGRKRVMLTGVAVFCVGSIVCALAPSGLHSSGPNVLIAGRIVMGIGAAASEPGTLSLVRQVYPDARERARALGVWAAVSGLGLAAGPVIAGILIGVADWRSVFWFNLAFGIVVFALAARFVPESADPEGRHVDLPGMVLGAVALGTATYAVIHGETAGYASPSVIALFVIGTASLVIFVVVERRERDPLLDLGYLRRPAFSVANAIAFVVYFATFAIFFFVALYLQLVQGISPLRLTTTLLPLAATMILGSIYTGRWVGRAGPRIPMTVGCLLAATGTAASDALIGDHPHLGPLAGTLAVAGAGFGIALVPVTTAALSAVPARLSGMAASATNTSRELGAVVGTAVLGAIVNGQLLGNLQSLVQQLGVPRLFQGLAITEIKNAIAQGGIPNAASLADNPLVKLDPQLAAQALAAIEHRFANGLHICLVLAAALLAVGGLVAAAGLSKESLPSRPT